MFLFRFSIFGSARIQLDQKNDINVSRISIIRGQHVILLDNIYNALVTSSNRQIWSNSLCLTLPCDYFTHFEPSQSGRQEGNRRSTHEPRHDKTIKVTVRPAKTQISLGIRPVWSESSLSAWRKLVSLANPWAHSEDSDQTERMPRLCWVFAGHTLILLFLSCRGSHGIAWPPANKTWLSRPVEAEKRSSERLILINGGIHMSLVTRKPVFGVCDQVRRKPACSPTKTS